MIKLLPQTLTGRLIAIFVLILLASQALNLALLVGEGRIAGRNNQVDRLMTQFMDHSRDLGAIDDMMLPKLIREGRDGLGMAFLSRQPHAKDFTNLKRLARHETKLRGQLQQLGIDDAKVLITRETLTPGARPGKRIPALPQSEMRGRPPTGPPGEFGGDLGQRRPPPVLPQNARPDGAVPEEIVVSAEVRPGVWLNVMAPHYAVETVTARAALITAASLMIALCAVLFLSRWIMRPIRNITVSAERFGRGVDVDALEETGPKDIQSAARAFNQMQSRLSRLLDTQRTMLRAVGHDLRTPITSLRLRAEDLPAGETRDKIIETLQDMTVMTEEILGWAKDSSTTEALATVDLGAMLASVADDYGDQGLSVGFEDVPAPIIASCRRVALRRALRNLIDNAINYAGSAHLSIEQGGEKTFIHVDDDGPGIPADQIRDVLRPFVRLEASRSKETGGIGLGLSIAQTIIETHGGTLTLENRSSGGLRATLALPRSNK